MRRDQRESGSMFYLEISQNLRISLDCTQISISRCGKCDRVGMVGLNCNKRDCNTKFHRYSVFTK